MNTSNLAKGVARTVSKSALIAVAVMIGIAIGVSLDSLMTNPVHKIAATNGFSAIRVECVRPDDDMSLELQGLNLQSHSTFMVTHSGAGYDLSIGRPLSTQDM